MTRSIFTPSREINLPARDDIDGELSTIWVLWLYELASKAHHDVALFWHSPRKATGACEKRLKCMKTRSCWETWPGQLFLAGSCYLIIKTGNSASLRFPPNPWLHYLKNYNRYRLVKNWCRLDMMSQRCKRRRDQRLSLPADSWHMSHHSWWWHLISEKYLLYRQFVPG